MFYFGRNYLQYPKLINLTKMNDTPLEYIIIQVSYLGKVEEKNYFIADIFADNIEETIDEKRYFYYPALHNAIEEALALIK